MGLQYHDLDKIGSAFLCLYVDLMCKAHSDNIIVKDMKSEKREIIRDVVIAVLIVISWVTLGLAMAQNGRQLTTKTARRANTIPAPAGFGVDWKTADSPSASADTLLPDSSTCVSPTPTPSSTSSAFNVSDKRVLGSLASTEDDRTLVAGPARPSETPVEICREGYVTDGPNEYKASIRKLYHEPIIPGNTARKVMEAVCRGGDPGLPNCGKDSPGCTWWSITGDIQFKGLLEENIGILEFVGGVIFPHGLDGPSITVPAVFPAAPFGEESLDVVFEMETWKLARESEELLRAVDEKLVDVAKIHIRSVRSHELGHWDIFEAFLDKYVAILNSPPVPNGYYYSEGEAEEALVAAYKDKWREVEAEEAQAHKDFESGEGKEKWEKIPINGFTDIYCIEASAAFEDE